MLQYCYIPKGHDIRDPRMSPWYATRETISQPVYLVGAEDDFLCDEARSMAAKLVGITSDQAQQMETPVGIIKQDGLADVIGWQHQGVRWEEILVSRHLDNARSSNLIAQIIHTYCIRLNVAYRARL